MPGDQDKTPEIARTPHARHERFTQIAFPIGDASMDSSSPLPTSALLDGSMTGDRTATDVPFTTRSGEVIDISSEGLLPQLIDVLHRLTEGQELLSGKIRDVRLGYTRDSAPVAETYPPSAFAAPRCSVRTCPDASIGVHWYPPRTVGDLDMRPTSVNGFGNGSSPEPAAAPSNPSGGMVTHAGTPSELSDETSIAGTEGLNAAGSGRKMTTPLNRDYNFFDELDARLAQLQDPTDRSGDR